MKIKKNNDLIDLLILFFLFLIIGCDDFTSQEEPCIQCPTDFGIIDYFPAWSPDGHRIAYCHADSDFAFTGIYLINFDGSNNLLWHQGIAEYPVWSPDGQWIAFSDNGAIWKRKLNGDSLICITTNGQNLYPTWDSQGKLIAYTQNICDKIKCGIWIINPKDRSNDLIAEYGIYSDFHPNEKKIIYTKRWVENNGIVLGDSVFLIDYSSGDKDYIISLSNPNYDNRYLKYNNTGTKILFTSQANNDNVLPSLWVMNVDGTNRELLLSNTYSADWNPEDNRIVYTDSHLVNGRLWILNLENLNKYQLTNRDLFKH